MKQRDPRLVLQCLQEECAELIQVCSKIVRFGPYSTNIELPLEEQETNLDLFHKEYADVLELVNTLRDHLPIDDSIIEYHRLKKREKLEKYLPYIENDN